MNLSKPDMWGPTRFKFATIPTLPRKSFREIDRQLKLWDSNHNTAELSAFYLVTIIEACKRWEEAKATKLQNNPTKHVQQRLAGVQRLKRKAFERLRWEAFQKKKDVGAKAAARGLSAGYQSERNQFLAGKRPGVATAKGGGFNPMGGSFVHESQQSQLRNAPTDIPGNLVATMNKQFETLTDQEFRNLHDYFMGPGEIYAGMQQPYVHFARKDERIQNNMLVCIRGLYYRNNGDQPYTTPDLDMYAMDKYGNLMVQPSNSIQGNTQYNHSSLNAGNDVICAGTCIIQNGLIHEIDNESGHYKPGRDQLHALLRVLIDDDMTDLRFATVKLTVPPGAPMYYRGYDITNFYNIVTYRGQPR